MMRAVTLPTWFGDARVQRALLLLLTVATYLGATQAAFVWDDRPLVVENQWIAGGAPLLNAFAVDLWETANVNASDQNSGYYRPLFLWSLAVDHTLHGLSEFGAHTQNLLWHLGAVSALYALLMRFFSPLGVEDFLKRMSVTRFEPPKLRELGGDVMRLAELEGLTGHARSVELRLQKIRRARRERDAAREAEPELEL